MRSALAFVRRHPVAAYFASTFTISWGAALLAIGGAGGIRGTTPASDPRFPYALIAMLAGPGISGITMTALVYGRAGLHDFVSRLLRWRVGWRWYAPTLIAPAALLSVLLALSLASPAFLPGLFTSEHKLSLLLISLAVGVSAGIFEELGWTGFAVPAMRRRHDTIATGVTVGIFWSAWHLLPNVWSARAAAGALAMPIHMSGVLAGIFIGYLTAFRVLMVWVYDKTRSTFIAMLMHFSITFGLLALNPLGISGMRLIVFSFAFAAALWIVAYWFPVREWMARWGATSSDIARVMTGDGLLADPTYSGTMAVIVKARPEHVWPWLVQIGYQRGGLYSYDWLDRLFGYLDRPSAIRILPEWQHLTVGDEIPLGRGPGWPVAVIDPNRALVLDMRNVGGFDWVWQFGIYSIDEQRTRVVSRSRVRTRTIWARLATYAIEPAGFLMTRRMLLGLKQRAEALTLREAPELRLQVQP
jgi:CAAX protease family protein